MIVIPGWYKPFKNLCVKKGSQQCSYPKHCYVQWIEGHSKKVKSIELHYFAKSH